MNILELMLTLTLAPFLFGAAWTIYLQLHQQSAALESKLQQANDILLIKHLLQSSIAEAGYTPCMPLAKLKFTTAILPYEVHGERLVLRKMGEKAQAIEIVSLNTLLSEGKQHFTTKQPYLISDCYQAQLVWINALHCHANRCLLTLTTSLPPTWTGPTFIAPMQAESFYLKAHQGLMFKSKQAALLSKHIISFNAKVMEKDIHVTLKTKNFSTDFVATVKAA